MLEFDVWTIAFSIINILVLFLFMKKFLFGRINAIMEQRAKLVQDDLDKAKSEAEKAQKIRTEYEATVSNAKSEAQEIISSARRSAEKQGERITQKAQKEAESIIKTAQKEIALERKQSIESAQAEIADLAIAAASKIVGANLQSNTNKELVDAFLAEEGGCK